MQQFEDLDTQARYVITESATEPSKQPSARQADKAPPIFVPAKAPPFTHRENDFDEYAAQPLLPGYVSRLGPALAAAGDYVYVGGAKQQAGQLFQLKQDSWLLVPGPWQDDAGHEDVGACFLDADRDGDVDLLVSSGGSEVASGDPLLRDRHHG